MHLSELQTKEIVNVSSGKRIGVIVDVVVNPDGKIKSLILEERKGSRRFGLKEESEILWEQIIKIGDDIILVENKK